MPEKRGIEPSAAAETGTRGISLRVLLAALRPKQWVKNGLVFAALVFSHDLFDAEQFARTVLGFLIFCLLSSAAYVFNDLMDRDQDRGHPEKGRRPIAAGRIPVPAATGICIGLALVGLAGAWLIRSSFGIVALTYLVLNLGYSLVLKHVVIVDVMILSSGFMLRLFAGAAIIDAHMSSWFIICTILLSLFLGLGKRRQEIVHLGDRASEHRSVLSQYTPYVLDQMIAVVTASALISYAIYTISEQTIEKFGTEKLVLTLPFVLYGIFRYLYLIHGKGKGDSPSTLMVEDVPMVINGILYLLAVVLIIYTV